LTIENRKDLALARGGGLARREAQIHEIGDAGPTTIPSNASQRPRPSSLLGVAVTPKTKASGNASAIFAMTRRPHGRFIGDEQVERPNAKNSLGLTLIAAAIIRLNSSETASLSPVSFAGCRSLAPTSPRVYSGKPNSSISEIMP
jgi:hypothetical protein